MRKSSVLVFLVTVYQCYGHYPNTEATQQDEGALDLEVVRDIANSFGFDIGGQFQLIEQSSGPDVEVMVIEYQSNKQNRHPGWVDQHGWKPPHPEQHHQPHHHQTQQTYDTSNRENDFWYHQTHQKHNGYEYPKRPTRPIVEHDYGHYNKYGNQLFNNQNPGHGNIQTHINNRPWIQQEGIYDNQNLANNQFNQNHPWYPNNINEGVGNDEQYPNNGIIAGTQNPTNNNPSDVVTTTDAPQNGDIADVEPVITTQPPRPNPLAIGDNKPEEEEEDFQIDVRFKGDE